MPNAKIEKPEAGSKAAGKKSRYANWQERMALIGRIVADLFEQRLDLTRMTDAAQLQVVGAVIEKMQSRSCRITTSQLVQLSRVLAEQRRLRVQEKEAELAAARMAEKSGAGAAALGEAELAAAIREIYGIQEDQQPAGQQRKN